MKVACLESYKRDGNKKKHKKKCSMNYKIHSPSPGHVLVGHDTFREEEGG